MNNILSLPRYVYLYFLCQSIHLIVAVVSVVVVVAAGEIFAPSSTLLSIPYGVQFLFLLLGTYPASMLMKKYGRVFGFTLSTFFLFFAGLVGYVAFVIESFALLILSHGGVGLFIAFANFYRYAITDNLPKALQPSALSLVIAGGVVASVIAPMMSITLKDVAGFPPFSLCYASFSLLAVVNLILIYFFPIHKNELPKRPEKGKGIARPELRLAAIVSIFVAAVGYGLMNLIMIQSSQKMSHIHTIFEDSTLAIQWHVIAMFLPSFFTGILIHRFGHVPVVIMGYIFLISSFCLNIQIISYYGIFISLILLGIGWNFTYVAGSSLFALSTASTLGKYRWQGIGDTIIAVFAMLGAVFPSFLLNEIGWVNSNAVAITICAFPVLSLIFLQKIFAVRNANAFIKDK